MTDSGNKSLGQLRHSTKSTFDFTSRDHEEQFLNALNEQYCTLMLEVKYSPMKLWQKISIGVC